MTTIRCTCGHLYTEREPQVWRLVQFCMDQHDRLASLEMFGGQKKQPL